MTRKPPARLRQRDDSDDVIPEHVRDALRRALNTKPKSQADLLAERTRERERGSRSKAKPK